MDIEIQFDFEQHRNDAIENYRKVRNIYDSFSTTLKLILEKCLQAADIKIHSIEARAKDIDKFGEKAAKPSSENSNEPKYKNPLAEIEDMCGVRVIAFFPRTLNEIDKLIIKEFNVLDRTDKNELLEKEEKLGYQSIHYIVQLKTDRNSLSEYSHFKDLKAEIQVRTILQHAWAEIEHDIEYKSALTIPKTIKRRFMALAGLLEMADREFQSIHDENNNLKQQSRKSVLRGHLEVEITGDSLKTFLNKVYGADARMTEFSYELMAKRLIQMGFKNLEEVKNCISGYNDDEVSRIFWGTRQGQLTRFEDVIIAAFGDDIIHIHPYCTDKTYRNDFWIKAMNHRLDILKKAKIETGKYNLK